MNCYLNGQHLYSLSIESLELILDTAKVDQYLIVDVNNELAYKLRYKNTSQAKQYALVGIKRADSIGYDLGSSNSYVTLGLIAKRERDISLAESHFLDALSIRQKVGSVKEIASVYNNLGLLFEKSNSNKAKEYYEKGVSTIGQEPSHSFNAVIQNNFGNFLVREQKFDEALVNLESALKIRKSRNNQNALANSYLNLSILYYELKDTVDFMSLVDSAQLYFNQSNDLLGLAKTFNLRGKYFVFQDLFGQAKNSFERAFSLAEENEYDQYRYKKNIGAIAIRRKEYAEALSIHKECLKYFSLINDKREEASTLINIGTIYYEQSYFEKAIANYEKALESLKDIDDIKLEAESLLFLSACYGHIGEFEKSGDIGLKYLKLSEAYNQQKSNSLSTLLDKKDVLIQNAEFKLNEVSYKLKTKQAQYEKWKMYFIIGCGITFLLILFTAIFYKQKKRIADYKINELLSKSELNANYARLEEQESERNRIARDLHDTLGSMFSAIKFSMSSVESTVTNIKEENKSHYKKVNDLIDLACDEIRNIAHNLRNSTLANFGLKVALESLVETLNEGTISIVLLTYGLDDFRMSNKIEINIYQIIQELASNALKHSKASKVTIQLNRFERRINISVEDNGVGFDRKKVKMGMGIINIETRVNELEGNFNLDSNKGNGSTIIIDIPLNKNLET